MTTFRFSAALAAGCLLSACSNSSGSGQNDKTCLTPPAVDTLEAVAAVKTPQDQATLTASCVHRWAYRLAKAEGPSNEIAKAVVGGCREAIDREGNLYLETSKDGMTMPQLERIRARLESKYSELALFHVVQARAGNCDVP
jgi:hypothetical protein